MAFEPTLSVGLSLDPTWSLTTGALTYSDRRPHTHCNDTHQQRKRAAHVSRCCSSTARGKFLCPFPFFSDSFFVCPRSLLLCVAVLCVVFRASFSLMFAFAVWSVICHNFSFAKSNFLNSQLWIETQSRNPSLEPMPTTTSYDEMKATLKAELKAELSAEFNEELHKLRQEVEKLRATFRAPPNDDVVDVQDVASYGTQKTVSEDSQDYNTSNGFNTCFKQQFVKIVKGSWLLTWHEKGYRVERRQELPDEAFWSPTEALHEIDERAKHIKKSKFLFVLSYRWLQSGHPDPQRHHLGIVRKFLTLAMQEFGDVGLFCDFSVFVRPMTTAIAHSRRRRASIKAWRLPISCMPTTCPSLWCSPYWKWTTLDHPMLGVDGAILNQSWAISSNLGTSDWICSWVRATRRITVLCVTVAKFPGTLRCLPLPLRNSSTSESSPTGAQTSRSWSSSTPGRSPHSPPMLASLTWHTCSGASRRPQFCPALCRSLSGAIPWMCPETHLAQKESWCWWAG